MNRPIKFRAWKKKEMQMFMITHLSFMKNSTGSAEDRGCEGYYGDNHRDRFSLDDIELMQFTGLLDKNGKEIYGGDIFQCRSGDDKADMQGEVYFDEGCFRMKYCYQKPLKDQRTDYFLSSVIENDGAKIIEVIGNIYENPELIK